MWKLPLLVSLALAPAWASCATCEPAPQSPAPEEPWRVLLLGDSISIGYTPFVREALGDRAHVVRPTQGEAGRSPENCAGTNRGVAELERWLSIEGGGWDVIHFNFGLHDLKRVRPATGENSNDPEHPHQASPARYEAQLRIIAARLQQTGARLVFATTTPVPEGGVRPYRDPADVLVYNGIATRIMAARGIRVNDLWAFVRVCAEPIQRPTDVHFTERGSQLLGEEVARAILQAAEPPVAARP